MIMYKVLLSGEILVSPPGLCPSLLSFYVCFVYLLVLWFVASQ
jgi:hypothetical protein